MHKNTLKINGNPEIQITTQIVWVTLLFSHVYMYVTLCDIHTTVNFQLFGSSANILQPKSNKFPKSSVIEHLHKSLASILFNHRLTYSSIVG